MIEFTEGSKMRTNASGSPKTEKPNIIPKGQMTEYEIIAEQRKYGSAGDYTLKVYQRLDENTVNIDGVKYQRIVEEPKRQTLLQIIREWCDDDNDPTCEKLVNRISGWLPKSFKSYGEYNEGWNDCLNEIKEKLK